MPEDIGKNEFIRSQIEEIDFSGIGEQDPAGYAFDWITISDDEKEEWKKSINDTPYKEYVVEDLLKCRINSLRDVNPIVYLTQQAIYKYEDLNPSSQFDQFEEDETAIKVMLFAKDLRENPENPTTGIVFFRHLRLSRIQYKAELEYVLEEVNRYLEYTGEQTIPPLSP